MSSERKNTMLLACALIIIITLISYVRVLSNSAFVFDDTAVLHENRMVNAGLTLQGVYLAFASAHEANWIPLTWLSHALDVSLFGFDARWHHTTNVMLHLLNSSLLLLVLHKLTGSIWRSFTVAALFAVHPLHVEAVAWITSRKDTLSGLFFMLTLLAYHAYARSPILSRYLVVLLLFVCGLCSKSMLVSVPFVLLLLDFWPLRRGESLAVPAVFGALTKRQFLIVEKLPLFFLAGAVSFITYTTQSVSGTVVQQSTYFINISNAINGYAMYILKMLLPLKLAVIYPFDAAIPLWKTAGAASLLAVCTCGAVMVRKQKPYVVTGWFWFLFMMLPVIGIIRFGEQSIADRYTYLPLIGLFILMVWGIAGICTQLPAGRKVAALSVAVIVLICMIVTEQQTVYWKDNITLFEHAVSVTRDNWLAHDVLGSEYAKQGNFPLGVYHLQETLRIKPDNFIAHNNLGKVYNNLGNHDQALLHFMKAIELKPDHALAHYNLGVVFLMKGDRGSAIKEYEALMRIGSSQAFNLLAAIRQDEMMHK